MLIWHQQFIDHILHCIVANDTVNMMYGEKIMVKLILVWINFQDLLKLLQKAQVSWLCFITFTICLLVTVVSYLVPLKKGHLFLQIIL